MTDHPHATPPGDPSGFWADERLVRDLKVEGSALSLRAATAIEWLRTEMIDPGEYMRVANERGAAFADMDQFRQFVALYRKTYMETQKHPSVLEEAAVMNAARALACS